MTQYNKMFGFIKGCFLAGLASLSTLASINLLSCISMNNQECKVRPKSQERMKQDVQNGMEHVGVNVDQMQAFVIINNVGMMINPAVNAKS